MLTLLLCMSLDTSLRVHVPHHATYDYTIIDDRLRRNLFSCGVDLFALFLSIRLCECTFLVLHALSYRVKLY